MPGGISFLQYYIIFPVNGKNKKSSVHKGSVAVVVPAHSDTKSRDFKNREAIFV